jgi:hypothetical protein
MLYHPQEKGTGKQFSLSRYYPLIFFKRDRGTAPVIIRLGRTYLKSKRKRISKKINKSLLTPTPGNPGRIPNDI